PVRRSGESGRAVVAALRLRHGEDYLPGCGWLDSRGRVPQQDRARGAQATGRPPAQAGQSGQSLVVGRWPMNPNQIVEQLQERLRGLYQQNRFEEAIEPATQLYQVATRYYGADSLEAATGLNTLGAVLMKLQHFDDAERVFDAALRLFVRHPAADALRVWT